MPPHRPRVRWSPTAIKDVRGIGDYLSREVPPGAGRRIFRTIHDTIKRISGKPFQGRSRGELRPGLRGALAGSYIVFYRPEEHGIEIVRVLHQHRDLLGAFDDDEKPTSE